MACRKYVTMKSDGKRKRKPQTIIISGKRYRVDKKLWNRLNAMEKAEMKRARTKKISKVY